MKRRGFLRSLFASTATIVVAPACVLDELPALGEPKRTYFDMGRNAPEDEIDKLIRSVRPFVDKTGLVWSANDGNHWRVLGVVP